MTRKELIKAIGKATLKPCPNVIPAQRAVITRTGQRVSIYGSCPHEPFTVEVIGFVYTDGRITFGKVFESRKAAILAWNYRQMRTAVEFMRYMRGRPIEDLVAQKNYWLKGKEAA